MSANPLEQKIQAESIIKDTENAMLALKQVLDQETALIKQAKLYDAANLEGEKASASLAYIEALSELDRVADDARTHALPALKRLSQSTQDLQKTIQMNLTVLATARTVSESIIQEVAELVSRKDSLQGYGANGAETSNKKYVPIAVSRKI